MSSGIALLKLNQLFWVQKIFSTCRCSGRNRWWQRHYYRLLWVPVTQVHRGKSHTSNACFVCWHSVINGNGLHCWKTQPHFWSDHKLGNSQNYAETPVWCFKSKCCTRRKIFFLLIGSWSWRSLGLSWFCLRLSETVLRMSFRAIVEGSSATRYGDVLVPSCRIFFLAWLVEYFGIFLCCALRA